MRGTTWEFVPGSDTQHIPVSIDERGVAQREDDITQSAEPIDDETEDIVNPKVNFDKLHVSQKAVRKYGPTPGCQACGIIVRRGHTTGRVGYNHSNACRARIIEQMRNDPEYRGLMQKQARQQEENQIEAFTKEEIEEMQDN